MGILYLPGYMLWTLTYICAQLELISSVDGNKVTQVEIECTILGIRFIHSLNWI